MYVIYLANLIFYIGESLNLRERLRSHQRRWKIEETLHKMPVEEITVKYRENQDRENLENKLIYRLGPIANVVGNAKSLVVRDTEHKPISLRVKVRRD